MNRTVLLPLLIGLVLVSGCATAVLSGSASGDREYSATAEDSRITREVRTAIYRDPLLADDRIHVTTTRGVVTLTGSVVSAEHVARAANLANAVAGVRDVNIELQLQGTP